MRFDALFSRFFRIDTQPLIGEDADIQGVAPPGAQQFQPNRVFAQPAEQSASGGAADANDDVLSIDLGTVFDPRDMRNIEDWMATFAQRVRRQLRRRHCRGKRGRVRFSRTLRHAHATAGEPFKLAFSEPRRQLPHVVVFVDVSQSMTAYSQFFLRFAKGLAGAFERCDVYGFDTDLIPLGDFVRPLRAKTPTASTEMGWRGGTRIAHAFDEFMRVHAHAVLKQKSTVLILSDGYDTAPPDRLAVQLELLSRRVRRVLWLHPLLARPSCPPLDPCLRAALPSIDRVMPAHSLGALVAVADEIV